MCSVNIPWANKENTMVSQAIEANECIEHGDKIKARRYYVINLLAFIMHRKHFFFSQSWIQQCLILHHTTSTGHVMADLE